MKIILKLIVKIGDNETDASSLQCFIFNPSLNRSFTTKTICLQSQLD
jgi:hypothetical protein